MSRVGELRMRQFPCEKCGAEVGRRCVAKSGRRLSYSHAPRFYAAIDAGLLPTLDKDEDYDRA